jgi:hypothetical protein
MGTEEKEIKRCYKADRQFRREGNIQIESERSIFIYKSVPFLLGR